MPSNNVKRRHGAAGPPTKRCYRTRTGNPLPLVAGILVKKTSFQAFAVQGNLIARLPIKNTLRELLAQGRFEPIAEMALAKKRVLGSLVSLTFDPDPLIAWRAVEAMGGAADRLAEHNPQCVREHL